MKKLLLTLLLFSAGTGISAAKTYDLKSPDGKIAVRVDVGADAVTYSISRDGKELIAPSPLSLTLADGRVLGQKATVRKASAKSVDETIEAPFYKRSIVEDRYNALTLTFKGDYGIDFRAYDDGVAYRFRTSMKGEITVADELVDIRFPEDFTTLVPYARDGKKEPGLARYYFNSFENTYSTQPVSKVADDHLAFLPILADAGTAKIVITEADLEDYPGMYLYNPTGGKALRGNFAPYPAKEVQGGHNELQLLVTEREDFIARTPGTRTFPWRVFAIAGRDIQLADNDLVYRLAAPSRVEDISWIKPGKVAWDWWNTWNLYGVDFKSGINNETYKYYIDFAADHGIEYVILDEGWAVNKKADLFQVVPEIDLPELVAYGKERGVGIVLWAGFYATERDLERVCKHYSEMGIKGFKVDFLDRDDQKIADFTYRLAETAAKYRLFLDMHGYPQARGNPAHLSQRAQLRGCLRTGADEVDQRKDRHGDLRRDDSLRPHARRTDGLHAGRHAQRHAPELPRRRLRGHEPGHALPPAGRIRDFRIAVQHAVRLAVELHARAGMHGVHRLRSDDVG